MLERLPVIATGITTNKLLDIPELPSSSEKARAQAVTNCLQVWDVASNVKAMYFDTTSSNTGKKSDACTLIEKSLGKNLLFLPCRHHSLKLVLPRAFLTCIKPPSGPDILLFLNDFEGNGML